MPEATEPDNGADGLESISTSGVPAASSAVATTLPRSTTRDDPLLIRIVTTAAAPEISCGIVALTVTVRRLITFAVTPPPNSAVADIVTGLSTFALPGWTVWLMLPDVGASTGFVIAGPAVVPADGVAEVVLGGADWPAVASCDDVQAVPNMTNAATTAARNARAKNGTRAMIALT